MRLDTCGIMLVRAVSLAGNGTYSYFMMEILIKCYISKYYLIYEQDCRIARILNSFQNDPFYTHVVSLCAKEFSL